MKKSILILFLLFGFFTGCYTPKGMYYWGNYSSTLYDLKKNPGEETFEKHKIQLSNIIETCEKREQPVPPGVYAEYGYMLLKAGNETDGMTFLNKEETTYPESTSFIERLKGEYERGKE